MPKMLMFSIAASSALAGAALVQLVHRREAFAGWMHGALSHTQDLFGRIRNAVMRTVSTRSHAFSSDNASYDAYRDAILRDLEQEREEFAKFLDRLRRAKEKEEFDAFLAMRRNPPIDVPSHDVKASKGDDNAPRS